jgi:hypothetical protein
VQVGDVDYLVCRQDRLACVEQIRIDPAFRDHKVASAAVRALLDRETDCAWSTTAVVDAPAAAALWRGVEGRVASLGVPVYCEHMRAVPVPDH